MGQLSGKIEKAAKNIWIDNGVLYAHTKQGPQQIDLCFDQYAVRGTYQGKGCWRLGKSLVWIDEKSKGTTLEKEDDFSQGGIPQLQGGGEIQFQDRVFYPGDLLTMDNKSRIQIVLGRQPSDLNNLLTWNLGSDDESYWDHSDCNSSKWILIARKGKGLMIDSFFTSIDMALKKKFIVKSLGDDEQFTDMIVKLKPGLSVKAHRCVLGIYVPSIGTNDTTIDFSDCEYAPEIVNWMYGRPFHLDRFNAKSIVAFADKWKMPDLMNVVITGIDIIPNLDYAMDLYQSCENLDLRKAILKKIKKDFAKQMTSDFIEKNSVFVTSLFKSDQ